jgi:hypothetical protein
MVSSVRLTTDQRGAIAELAIARRAMEMGVDVYRPVAEGGRYDLIFGLGGRLLRVQCKWARLKQDIIPVPFYSSRRTADGLRRRVYTAVEIDAVAAYCPDIERCFLLPYSQFDGRTLVHLRLGPSRNNQRVGVNWADEFAFERLQSASLGP